MDFQVIKDFVDLNIIGLIFAGIIWGVTNPLIEKGSKDRCARYGLPRDVNAVNRCRVPVASQAAHVTRPVGGPAAN